MRIGIDFDNTIVCYDALFHKVALEGGHIPADLPPSKLQVRDHLRRIGQEDVWTEMQGYVYGARMAEADPYPGVVDALRWARRSGLEVSIVSHKTRHPFRGPAYDLHEAAANWVGRVLQDEDGPLVPPDRVHFELTKADKLARIAACGCTLFIDDLPEILLAPAFPPGTARLLFDPDGHHPGMDALTVLADWAAIRQHVEARCPTLP